MTARQRSATLGSATAPRIAAPLAELAVPLTSVSRHPRNARVHDLDELRRSLRSNGQYRPIVVNRRDGLVLAGNGTHEAAELEGWEQVAVTWVDVDDEAALRILLVDNRASDLSSYDDTALVALLEGLDDLEGTGYSHADLAAIVAGVRPPKQLTDPDDAPPPAAASALRGGAGLAARSASARRRLERGPVARPTGGW